MKFENIKVKYENKQHPTLAINPIVDFMRW